MLPKRFSLNRYSLLWLVLPLNILIILVFLKVYLDEKTSITSVQEGGIYRHALSLKALMEGFDQDADAETLLKAFSLPEQSEFDFSQFWLSVLSMDGEILATNSPFLSPKQKISEYPEVIAAKAFSLKIVPETWLLLDGGSQKVKSIALQTKTRNKNLIIHMSYPDAQFAGISWVSSVSLIVCYILILLSLLFLVFSINKKLGQAIYNMRSIIKNYSLGNYTLVDPTHSFISVEISRLENSIRRLGIRLAQQAKKQDSFSAEQQVFLANMDEGIVVLDHEFKVIHINDAFCRLFTLDINDVAVGKRFEEGVRIYELNEFVKLLAKQGSDIQKVVTFSGIPPRVFSIKGKVIKKESDSKSQFLLIIKDISQITLLERQRKEFVANVSHELKTPLTSVKGYLEIIEDAQAVKEDTELKKFLSRALEQTGRLESIVSSMSDLSRLENRDEKSHQSFSQENIINPIKKALEAIEIFARKKSINLKCHFAEIPEFLIHPSLIHQAVFNLLDNAIKYSDQGGTIEIDVAVEDNSCVIKVIDYGPGIPKSHLFRIFERFYRVDEGRSREAGGTGLGLAIVKHVALAHGGTVDVDSQLGKGTTFTMKLPFSQ